MKSQGLSEEEIDEQLQETLAMDKKEIELLKADLNSRGKMNLAIGFAIIGLIITIFFIGAKLSFGAVIPFGIGVWRIIIGSGQVRK